MATDFVIDVEDVTKSFDGHVVVNKIAMQVAPGEIYGFLGPNGSGKTTFLRILCGLLHADAGRGTCLGYDIVTQTDEIKQHIGYMTQKFSLYEDLTIEENLDFVARVYGVRERKEAVEHSLHRLGLMHRRRQLAGTLSGGWKQRLSLAACLIHRPQLLLLDEPTAGVDPKARRDFWEEIHQLAAEGLTALVTTHYMDEAERCHRLAYISYGNLLAHGTAEEVVAQSGLTTWVVSGGNLHQLANELRQCDGVEQVVAFGDTLHVSGRDASLVDAAASRFHRPPWHWKLIKPSLEDVFIELMDTAKDNFS
ncbi:MAG: ABC transporter ATP-binding protein [bacterium]